MVTGKHIGGVDPRFVKRVLNDGLGAGKQRSEVSDQRADSAENQPNMIPQLRELPDPIGSAGLWATR